jgi:hypothetical protein
MAVNTQSYASGNIRSRLACAGAIAVLLAASGCSKIGDVTVKPVVNKALENSRKETEELSKQAKEHQVPGMDKGIQPIPTTTMPGIDANSMPGTGSN